MHGSVQPIGNIGSPSCSNYCITLLDEPLAFACTKAHGIKTKD